MKVLKFILKVIASIVCFALLLISTLYLFTKIYNFPEFEPFSGEALYNPYVEIESIKPLKSNFHAHTAAWGGITDGTDSNEEVVAGYAAYNYDIIGISNYHSIDEYLKDSDRIYISNYEHGYNIFKSHKLGLNADKVSFLDYPLFQLPSHKQHILEILNKNGATPIIAHPKFVNGHTFHDLSLLVNYSLIEVLNHYRISDEYWDAALSAGHPVFVNGSDDTHGIHREATFERWTMVFSPDKEVDSILDAMTSGKAYGVDSKPREQDIFFIKSEVIENGFRHHFDVAAPLIKVIGQGGKLLKEIKDSSFIEYTFQPEDTYARVFVDGIKSDLYINPVLRYDGKSVPSNYVDNLSINQAMTWLFRLAAALVVLLALFLLLKVLRW